MHSAMSRDFQRFGTEPDNAAREKYQEFGGVVWDSASSARKTGLTCYLVTMFHVNEHLYEPFEELDLLQPTSLSPRYIKRIRFESIFVRSFW